MAAANSPAPVGHRALQDAAGILDALSEHLERFDAGLEFNGLSLEIELRVRRQRRCIHTVYENGRRSDFRIRYPAERALPNLRPETAF